MGSFNSVEEKESIFEIELPYFESLQKVRNITFALFL